MPKLLSLLSAGKKILPAFAFAPFVYESTSQENANFTSVFLGATTPERTEKQKKVILQNIKVAQIQYFINRHDQSSLIYMCKAQNEYPDMTKEIKEQWDEISLGVKIAGVGSVHDQG